MAINGRLLGIFLLFYCTLLPVYASETGLEWLRPGMKGYGLTVFKGTVPEKFDVEVIGILKNPFPDQDLILVKCSGHNLEFTGIAGGMSGSPIYIEGKLIGALAYGWSFAKEPIAGVTPITNILKELDRVTSSPGSETIDNRSVETVSPGESSRENRSMGSPVAERSMESVPSRTPPVAERFVESVPSRIPPQAERSVESVPSRIPPQAERSVESVPSRTPPQADRDGFWTQLEEWRALDAPLMVSGVNSSTMELVRDLFADYPVTPQIGSGEIDDSSRPTPRLRPGSALAVKLIRGDISVAAIGTVTYIEGDYITAFGHPFFGRGRVNFPYSPAEIFHIFSSTNRSFKLGAGFADDLGVIVGDRLSSITGASRTKPDYIPVRIDLRAEDGSFRKTIACEVVRNEQLSPQLIMIAIAEGINNFLTELEPNMVTVDLAIRLTDGTSIELDDLFFNPTGGLNLNLLLFLAQTTSNPFGKTGIVSVNCSITQERGRKTAVIEDVLTLTPEVAPGDTARFLVNLKPFGEETVTSLEVALPVPAQLPDQSDLIVQFKSGSDAILNRPLPQSRDQYFAFFNDLPGMDELVSEFFVPSLFVDLKGKRVPGLPTSFAKMLGRRFSVQPSPRSLVQHFQKTDWVLQGQAVARIKLSSER